MTPAPEEKSLEGMVEVGRKAALASLAKKCEARDHNYEIHWDGEWLLSLYVVTRHPLYFHGIIEDAVSAIAAYLGTTESGLIRPRAETAWLIERPSDDGPNYWGSCPEEGVDWTRDHMAAMRFCRRQDAELLIEYYGWTDDRIVAVEHQWG